MEMQEYLAELRTARKKLDGLMVKAEEGITVYTMPEIIREIIEVLDLVIGKE